MGYGSKYKSRQSRLNEDFTTQLRHKVYKLEDENKELKAELLQLRLENEQLKTKKVLPGV